MSLSFPTCLLRPIRHGGGFFVFNYLLLLLVMLPACVLNAGVVKMNFFSFVEAFADLYLVAWLLSALPRRLRHVAEGLATVINFLTVLTDCFVRVHFHTFINAPMLRLALETNADEAGGFFTSYVFQPLTILLLLPFLVWGAVWAFYVSERGQRLRQRISQRVTNGWRIAMVAALLILGLGSSVGAKVRTWQVWTQPNLSEMEMAYGDSERLSLYSSFHRFIFAVHSVRLANDRLVRLRQTHEHLQATRRSDAVPTVVLIIGESFNRSHSSLYGYPLPVTPLQQARADRGELIPFTDVVSCWNLTSYVFQHLFSLYSVDSPRAWESYPLFPALFRQAGYHSTFLSNQFPQSVSVSISAVAGSFFLNDPVLNDRLFDLRNTSITPRHMDDDLLAMYDSLCVDAPRRLVIFSLLGMHFNYDERIPDASWRRFTERDYRHKPLPRESRQILADYDNATRYNDWVVNEIVRRFEAEDAVVVYCPDHGEELFDGTGVSGRTYPAKLSRAEMHNQFDVPFWIWCSAAYRQRRPHELERLRRARSLPFMTDDLPHLLLDLAGVQSPEFEAERSPLSPQYNVHRKRLLRQTEEYLR